MSVEEKAIRVTTGAEAFIAERELNHFQGNLKKLSDENYHKLRKEILELGFCEAVSAWRDPEGKLQILNGHQRLRTVRRMIGEGYHCPPLPVNLVEAADLKEAHRKVLALTSQYGEITKDGLSEFMEMSGLELGELKESFRFPEIDWKEFDQQDQTGGGVSGGMLEKFGVPPFTILDTRQGYWQDRKKVWKGIGIKSELGRSEKLLSSSEAGNLLETINAGTSIFDPVLCELAYTWFCPRGGLVLDPFAGGSVRGVVASHLGRHYVGIELRAEQVAANRAQEDICKEPIPVWHQGDSEMVLQGLELSADMLIACPPYFDLEKYSDDPADLSNMSWDQFARSYTNIIEECARKLRDDRFAVWILSDIRDDKGMYRNLPAVTIKAFEDAGMHLYNEAVLVNAVGTLHLRAGRSFSAGRKLGRTHQDVLIFVKGDPKRAVEACGEIEVFLPEAPDETAALPPADAGV